MHSHVVGTPRLIAFSGDFEGQQTKQSTGQMMQMEETKGYTFRVSAHPPLQRPTPSTALSTRARSNKFKKWKRQFKVIKNSIYDLASKRFIYMQVTKLIEDNPRIQVSSAFYDWMHGSYVTDMSVHIRRLADRDMRAISLYNLLKDIEHHPEVISRRRFTHPYKNFMKRYGHKDFDRLSKPGGDVVNKKLISKHRTALVKSQERLRIYTNKHVAHLDKVGMKKFPTYAELDACIDTIERLAKDCTLLLEQSALTTAVPAIQYDWMAPFRFAWIMPRSRLS